MWDNFGFSGSAFENDPGVKNVTAGVARVVTGVTETLASCRIDDFAKIADNDFYSLAGFFQEATAGGPPYPNVLEQFASYTPLWTLACLSPDQFNTPSLYRGKPAALQNIVFSSAGRFAGQRAQTIVGAPEYFVNNFTMDMTLAATQASGSTNVINFSWDVIEPYSMGYFIHSLQTAAINAGYPNYNGTPFLLKLEFVGHRDNGQMFGSSEALNKYFVIQFKNVTFTTTEGGRTYKCEAVPANHLGFTNVAQQVMNNIKLRGENIKEMLIAGTTSLCSVLNKAQYNLVPKTQDLADQYIIVFPEKWNDPVGLPGAGAEQFETIQRAIKNLAEPDSSPIKGRIGQDSLSFGDGVIGNSSLGFGATSGGNVNFGFESDVTDEATGLIKRNTLTIDPKQREFSFEAGVTIQNVIQEVILSSEYAKNAIDPSKIDSSGRINWFRVDVQIKIGDYDLKRNCRQRTYIFRVLPFKVHVSVFRNPTANPPGYPGLNKIIGKEYKYIYTGQNNDILKFDIQINQLFHTGKQPTPPENSSSVANPGGHQGAEDPDQVYKVPDTDVADAATTLDAAPAFSDRNTTKQTTKGGYGAQTVARRVAETLKNAILNQGTGDMTKINLDIIGDPYWISDSGMGNYLGDEYDGNPYLMRDAGGSVNYQGADTHIRIIFRTPVEPNLGTTGSGGLYNFPPNEPINPYSGIYKVIKCTNKFSDGKFTQSIEATRMPNQPQDYDPYKGPSKQPTAADISQQDTPDTSVNQDDAASIGVNEDGYAVGIRLYDETGQESNFRRNPETGELYDATELQRNGI
jgi:hypothetical protein